MSLLLDALNRAGKDKAAAASADEAKAGNDWPAIGLLPQGAETEAAVPASLPAASSAPAEVAVAMDFVKPDAGLSLEPVLSAPEPLTILSEPLAAPLAPPVRTQDPEQPPERKATQAAAPEQASKVAQTLLRAKTPAASSRRPQLLVLGGLAGLLAAGLASVFLGWVDPVALLSPGSGVKPATQMASADNPPVASPAPPATVVPPAVAAAEIVTKPPAAQEPPPFLTTKPGGNPSNTKRKSDGKSTPDRQMAPALAGAATPPSGDTAKASGPLADCTAGSTATECRPAARPVTKARPKLAAPKPAEPASAVIAKVTGPSQLEVGYAALTQGQWTEATAAYNKALAENPEERDALLGLAYIAHQGAREEEARELYKRVLRQEPGNPSARAGLLVQTLGNDSEDVSGSSRDVAEQHPGSAAAQSVLGHSLVRQGRLADAQQAFQRAHVLEPGIALHAYNLAVALDRLRNYGAARSYYDRALALSRQNGGEASSGVSHTVIQNRLQELQGTRGAEAPATR